MRVGLASHRGDWATVPSAQPAEFQLDGADDGAFPPGYQGARRAGSSENTRRGDCERKGEFSRSGAQHRGGGAGAGGSFSFRLGGGAVVRLPRSDGLGTDFELLARGGGRAGVSAGHERSFADQAASLG